MSRRHKFSLGSFGAIEYLTGAFLKAETSFEDSFPLPLPSALEMRALDQREISQRTPSVTLIERAATAVVEEIALRFPKAHTFLILVGPGNNGADGLAVARMLRDSGRDVVTVTTSTDCVSMVELQQLALKVDLIVDGLLGIGQDSSPRPAIAEIITCISQYATAPIVAIDVPTGINCSTGEVYTPCIHATLTVAIQSVKRGMLQFPARSMCGDIVIRDIGIPTTPDEQLPIPTQFSVYMGEGFSSLRSLSPDVHKGRRGRVLVIGGSRGMPGAPALSALACLRTGAGVVTVASKPHWGTFEYLPPEAMRLIVSGESDQFTSADLPVVISALPYYSAVILGPGLGDAGSSPTDLAHFTKVLVTTCADQGIPLLLDASGLVHMVDTPFPKNLTNTVITPHPGEAAQLLGCSPQSIQRDRFSAVRDLAQKCNCVAVLKGAGTLIHTGNAGHLVPLGTPYLATAGSGDVLSGVIATYLAQGIPAVTAACVGVYHHVQAGLYAARNSEGVIASDIADALGLAHLNK